MIRSLTVLALTLVLPPFAFVACGERNEEDPRAAGVQARAPQISDSAGVRVVTNAAPGPDDPTFNLSAQPLASIGTAEGTPAYQLFRANQAFVLSDSTIVVANRGSFELRFYDRTGEYLSAGGAKGEGPGEFGFNGFDLLGTYRGDSIVTEDRTLKRFSVFDKTGKFVRSIQFPPSLGLLPSPGGVLADGRVVALDDVIGPGRGFGERNPRFRMSAKVFVVSSDGSSVETVGEFPGEEASVGRLAAIPVYFGRNLQVNAGGDRIAIANTDAYSVRIYDEAGTLLQIVRQTRLPMYVQEGDFAEMKPPELRPGGAMVNSPSGRAYLPLLEQMYRYTTFPAFGGEGWPAFPGAVRFDTAGNLWVQEYRLNREAPDRWEAFSPAGAFIGRLDLPAKTYLLDVGTDYALLKVIDELDVEHVVLYGLERTAGTVR